MTARLEPRDVRRLAVAVTVGCLVETLVGWRNFLTGTGGLASEPGSSAP